MSNQLQKLPQMLAVTNVRNRFNEVLGQKTNQFIASLISLNNSTALNNCEPQTVLSAAMTAATLDLPINPNLGFAYIIPYGKQAQFQMGYKGYIQLAMRTGQYVAMNAICVNQEAYTGTDDIGEPTINFDLMDETKPAIGYFFAFRLINGFSKKVYWTKTKVEDHAKRYSQAFRSGKKDSPWNNNFDSMALKTIIKLTLAKWAILSVEMQHANDIDQAVINDNNVDYVDSVDIDATETKEPTALEMSLQTESLNIEVDNAE
jgi:recombination protein RecT